MSFNKIILVGNLGRDPELRYTAQGTPVCSFSMATNERRKDRNGEMQDHTTWFRITLWKSTSAPHAINLPAVLGQCPYHLFPNDRRREVCCNDASVCLPGNNLLLQRGVHSALNRDSVLFVRSRCERRLPVPE